MKRPFLLLWTAYALGIYLDCKVNIAPEHYKFSILLAGFIFISLKLIRHKASYVFLLLTCLLLGALLFNLDYNKNQNTGVPEKERLTVKVLEEKSVSEKYSRYIVKGKDKERMLLTAYDELKLQPGDIISVRGSVHSLKKNKNPGLFSSENYYKSQYIYRNIAADKVQILKRDNLGSLESLRYGFRGFVENSIDSSLKSKDKAIIKSMMLGKSSFIEENRLEQLRDIGLGHMLAVSGFHIGVIFSAVILVFRDALGFHKRIAEVSALLIAWSYILLIGSPVSSVRAGIMITALIVSKLADKRYDALNIIGFTGFAMILLKPLWALSLGYQLSFVGVIVLAAGKGRKLKSLFSVIIGLLPFNAYYFNDFSLFSFAANVVLVPFLSASLLASFLLVAAARVSTNISKAVGLFIDGMLHFSDILIDLLNNSHNKIVLRSPTEMEIIFFYILFFTALKAIDIKSFDKKVLKAFIAYSLSAALLTAFSPYKEEIVEIDFIDVGQGDCALIRISNKAYLLDSGGSVFSDYDVGEHTVYPYLVKQGVDKLDGIIVSHFDADHMKGFLHLMEKIKIEEIIVGYRSAENELCEKFTEIAADKRIPLKSIETPLKKEIDENSKMTFIPTVKIRDENNNSLILVLESFGTNVLFSGDIEKEREDELLNLRIIENMDILKVPHHGSSTSSSESFLNYVSPKAGIIQVGKNNFGHPNSEILNRYESIGANVYRNDISGMIKLSIDKSGYKIEEFISSKPDLTELFRKYKICFALLSVEIHIWVVLLVVYKNSLGLKL